MGLAKKITFMLIALLMMVGVLVGVFGYEMTYRQIDESLGIETVGCANITSGLVNPQDIEALAQGDSSLLHKVETNINWIVHKKPLFKEAFILSLDGKILASDKSFKERGYTAGDSFYFDQADQAMIRNMKHSLYSKVYTYDNTRLKTGYGPIYKNNDSTQEIIALLAINVDASLIQKRTIEILVLPFTIGAILFIAAALAVYLIIRTMVKPLSFLSASVHLIAEGDLSQPPLHFKSHDEIGTLADDFNKMTSNLKNLISEVNDTSLQVASSSEELSASSKQTEEAGQQTVSIILEMADGAEKQLERLEANSHKMTEMSQFLSEISVNTEHALVSAADNLQNAQAGKISMNETKNQMLHMSESIQELSGTIESLRNHSHDIRQMLSLMTEMAEETNLLALNAAIEAARAGEEGKGFAIVASAVKKLSNRSAQSAEDISNVVSKTLTLMETASEKMSQTVLQVTEGSQRVIHAGTSFEQIEASASQITAHNEYISNAVLQLSDHAHYLTSSARTLVEVANQTLDGTQSVSAASQQQLASMAEVDSSASLLSSMSDKLHTLIERFKI